ncbi:MAG: hypothetical protein BAJALOKI3v1_40059 [Promethearchaeota archaeon]|nr:MAG: hypothetical protein BAJALOKI3v1_40059 [Candidatus Lokiarchaeota archaeon]
MSKVGIATLSLHSSKAPRWLLKRMIKLGLNLMNNFNIHDGEAEAIRLYVENKGDLL